MERRGFKLYNKFNRRDGLPLWRIEKFLKACGLDTNKDNLRVYMDRAINLGFAEKRARRYRMPWKLCDYHIARTLGVRGLPVPKARAISKGTAPHLLAEDKTTSTSSLPNYRIIENSNVKRSNNNKTMSVKNNLEELDEAKLEDINIELESNEMARSPHYLITDYWKGVQSFFGILETEEQRNTRGDFALPVARKMWQLRTEPETQVSGKVTKTDFITFYNLSKEVHAAVGRQLLFEEATAIHRRDGKTPISKTA